MMFFSNPQVIFDSLRSEGYSSIIVPHRFKTKKEEKKAFNEVGVYCVEFNTFANDKNGMEALKWWADKCLEWRYYAIPRTTEWYGDQKYLSVFPEKFKRVMICDHYGVGLAPWNTELEEEAEYNDDIPMIKVKETGEIFPVILYHFESVGFLTENILHAPSGIKSNRLHSDIYDYYINLIISKRKYILNKYGFNMSKSKRIVTNNKVMKLYQKYISPLRRVKQIKDLYIVK